MNKITSFTTISLAVITMAFVMPGTVHANSKTAASSAAFTNVATSNVTTDNRAQILREYLLKQNSPLAGSADTFVEEADKYGLDWKLVAAISGLESGFGKQIPPYSYNGWGWGVYGDNVMRFNSWDEAIATISKGLRENYIDKMGSADIYRIGRTYAASPTWAVRVENFMNQIERFKENWTPTTLSVSI